MTSAPWRIVTDGVVLSVRVTPKAGRDRVNGLTTLADGGLAIRATVTAAPENGKANAALMRLLAKTWRLPRSAFAVTGGATGRLKRVTITGDGQALDEMLQQWRAATAAPTPTGSKGDRT